MKNAAVEETLYGDLSTYSGTSRVLNETHCGSAGVLMPYREATAVAAYSNTIGLRETMRQLYEDAAVSNWDGEGAVPVSGPTKEWGRKLRDSIPSGIPTPDLSIDRQGHVNFDWESNQDRVAVAIDERGVIYFISFVRGNRTRGVIKDFSGAFPRALLDAIHLLLGE